MFLIALGALALDAELGGCDTPEVQHAALLAIEARNAQAQASLLAGDVPAYADVFTVDAWQVSPDSLPLEGRAAIEAQWTQMASLGDWQFDLNPLEVWVCNGSAVERGYGELSFTPNAAMEAQMPPFTAGAHYVAHWVEEAPGVWRVRSEAATAIP